MEGWLKKKGENLGALFWKDRWFKEEDGKLSYYTNPSLAVVKGHIEFKHIKDVRPRLDNFGWSSGFGLEIETETRTYCLLASKEAVQLAWVNGILARIEKKKKFVLSGTEWISTLKSVARSSVITVKNDTPYVLSRENFKLHGAGQEWRKFPPEKLQPGETAVFGSCSSTLITGTAASVTFRTQIDLDDVIVWFRWENPFRKLAASKKALFEAPGRIKIVKVENLSDSSRFIADSDIYRVNYTISFDPQLESSSTARLSQSADHALIKEWVDLDKDSSGPKMKPGPDGSLGQVIETSYGKTKYYLDWIPSLKNSARSVLITIINDTPYDCNRMDWSLNRGLWRAIPAETISKQTMHQFGTASHGLLGFRSGTIGSVTYSVKLLKGECILSFDWTNHMMWGIYNNVALTSSAAAGSTSISVLTESVNEAACEITFTIVEGSNDPNASPKVRSASNASSSGKNGANSSIAASSSSDNEIEDLGNGKVTVKKTFVKRVQEDGVTVNHSQAFMSARKSALEAKKSEVLRIETDLELVTHDLIHNAKRKQDQSNFFNSLFSKEPTLQDEAENVAPTRTPSPISTSQCPITNQALPSPLDKRYCYLCGRIVHRSVIVSLPFPSTVSDALKELKKHPRPVQACLDCNDIITRSERPISWRKKLKAAAKHPVLVIHEGLVDRRSEVKSALQDLRKMKALKDKHCGLVVTKIKTLLNEIDDLQMQLFALNEDLPRAEQKLNNTMALFITNWKEEVTPELEALQSE